MSMRYDGLYTVEEHATFFTLDGDKPCKPTDETDLTVGGVHFGKDTYEYPDDPMYVIADYYILTDGTTVKGDTNQPIAWVVFGDEVFGFYYIEPKYLIHSGHIPSRSTIN